MCGETRPWKEIWMNLSTTNICRRGHTSSRVSLYLSSLLHTIDERKETTARESHGKTYLKLAQKKKENKTIIGPANFAIHLIERKRRSRKNNNNNNNQIQRSLSLSLALFFCFGSFLAEPDWSIVWKTRARASAESSLVPIGEWSTRARSVRQAARFVFVSMAPLFVEAKWRGRVESNAWEN